MTPVIAIIGRPNVGKSTLFNRITKTRKALVDNFPGVTRDRHSEKAEWNDHQFIVIDTGGFSNEDDQNFIDQIQYQAELAINEADFVIFILDGKAGLLPIDMDLIHKVRQIEKPVFYAVNKIDTPHHENKMYEFFEAGLPKLYPISAEHRYGVRDLLDDITALFPQQEESDLNDSMIKIAVVGRPNAGKSSLINRITGQTRLMVSAIPGTTRDAIDTICTINQKSYLLIDTAGIRKKSQVNQKIEKLSVIKAMKSLERCDIALILIDAELGVTEQDIKIAGYAYERHCGCIFVLNKWDCVEKNDQTKKKFVEMIQYQAKFLNFAPIITISALTGKRIHRVFDYVDDVYEQYATRLNTGQVNRIIDSAIQIHPPPFVKGKQLKIYYATQVSSKPPTFIMFANYSKDIHFSYVRYLINAIRKASGLEKTPIRLIFKQRDSHTAKNEKNKN